ncbi:unnamed protein product, partial [Polarella glacialis]
MSVFGGPLLEEAEIEELLARFPGFKGPLPEEARLWTEAELELFLASDGRRRPICSLGGDGRIEAVAGLLSRTRLMLAELRIDSASQEYLSYCRHREQRTNLCNLPAVASCSPVQRAREVPGTFLVPVTVVPRRARGVEDPKWQSWGSDFWREHFGMEWCQCRARWPAFEQDATTGIDALSVEAGLWEYLDYMQAVEVADAACLEEQSLAYPRLQVGDFCPFAGLGRRLFQESWREFSPPGVSDLTERWLEFYTSIFEEVDAATRLSEFYRLSFQAPGCVTRLHRENHNAHVWFTQLEGQRLFFLFPPED